MEAASLPARRPERPGPHSAPRRPGGPPAAEAREWGVGQGLHGSDISSPPCGWEHTSTRRRPGPGRLLIWNWKLNSLSWVLARALTAQQVSNRALGSYWEMPQEAPVIVHTASP